jgi:hypothetical protein
MEQWIGKDVEGRDRDVIWDTTGIYQWGLRRISGVRLSRFEPWNTLKAISRIGW